MRLSLSKIVAIVLATLVLGACIALLVMRFLSTPALAQKVVIEQDGVVVYEAMLKNEDGAPVHTEELLLHFTGSLGEYTVALHNGMVRMVSSLCPDQLCVHQGLTDDPNTPIVCLPQRIIISVEDVFDEGEEGSELVSYTQHRFLFDTIVGITVFAGSADEAGLAIAAAFEEFEAVERMATRYGSDAGAPSDIQRINDAAGVAPQVVDQAIIIMLERALSLSELGEGSFNPAIGPIVDLWAIGNSEKERVPSSAEIKPLLPLVDMTKIEINAQENTVFLTEAGMSLDLGSVAKGYATDRAAEALRANGIEHALISAGGNIYALGGRPDGSPWRVGIQDPRHEGEILAVTEIFEGSVVTSGDDQRYFVINDTRYHHIFDPNTGMPAQGVWQATVVSDCSMDADILSTICFILGPEKSERLFKQLGLSGVIVDADAQVFLFINDKTVILPELKEGYHFTH
ncbi:MAG: FAD:protein FMN transferase [Coriobacteriia bacterium]|nr:FAD:protein FMN transferase [Coriobacteriia bacterium]